MKSPSTDQILKAANAAWAGVYAAQQAEDLDEWLAAGWKTAEIVREGTDPERSVNSIRCYLMRDPRMESRTIRVHTPTGVRRKQLFRPKHIGLNKPA